MHYALRELLAAKLTVRNTRQNMLGWYTIDAVDKVRHFTKKLTQLLFALF